MPLRPELDLFGPLACWVQVVPFDLYALSRDWLNPTSSWSLGCNLRSAALIVPVLRRQQGCLWRPGPFRLSSLLNSLSTQK